MAAADKDSLLNGSGVGPYSSRVAKSRGGRRSEVSMATSSETTTSTGTMLKVIEPATEETLAELPHAGVEEANAAVARAKAAFPEWRALAPGDRGRMLRAIAEAIAARGEELARLEAR